MDAGTLVGESSGCVVFEIVSKVKPSEEPQLGIRGMICCAGVGSATHIIKLQSRPKPDLLLLRLL